MGTDIWELFVKYPNYFPDPLLESRTSCLAKATQCILWVVRFQKKECPKEVLHHNLLCLSFFSNELPNARDSYREKTKKRGKSTKITNTKLVRSKNKYFWWREGEGHCEEEGVIQQKRMENRENFNSNWTLFQLSQNCFAVSYFQKSSWTQVIPLQVVPTGLNPRGT